MKKFFRYVSQSSKGTWTMALIAFGVIMVLGCVFYALTAQIHGVSLWSYLYAALNLNSPKDEVGSDWVLGLHFLLGLLATLMLPFVTAVLTEWHREKVSLIREGKDIHEDMKDHYVLIGYNLYTTQVLRHCLRGNEHQAIVMTSQDPYMVRERINNGLGAQMAKRVILYAGDAIEQEKTASLNLGDALQVYLLDESDEHESQYTRNLSVLSNIVDGVSARLQPLEVYMQVNNAQAYSLMQRIDIPTEFFRREGKIVVDFRPFNFYENWSRLLWSYHKLPQYDVLDYEPLEETDKHVHLVIAGFNSMGRALMLEALRLCHYPNYEAQTTKTQITVFEPQWQAMKDSFNAQYPYLDQIEDVAIDFRETDINSPAAREALSEWAQDKKTVLTIAICDKEADTAMTKGLNLPEAVYRNEARVLVRQELESVNADMVAYGNRRVYPHVQIFGMLQDGLDIKHLDDRLAMCIGGIYTFYSGSPINLCGAEQLLACQQKIRNTLAEKSEADWLEGWLNTMQTDKWANRFQSDVFKNYTDFWQRHPGLTPEEYAKCQELLAEAEHRRWMAERTVCGFRQATGNEKKDKAMRIHTDIVPYDELDEKTKNYDRNVVNTAPLLVKELQRM